MNKPTKQRARPGVQAIGAPVEAGTNPPRLDGRTRWGKRARALEAELIAGLGNHANAWQRSCCRLGALLQVVAEQTALRAASGDQSIDADSVTRTASAARRAIADSAGVRPPTEEEKEAAFIRAALAKKYGREPA